MEPFSQISHKLIRDGVSQPERKVSTLSPDSVRLDGREVGDFLDFIFQFSRQINFYKNKPDERAGDWTNFFLKSIPVHIALIGKYDLEAVDRRFLEISETINDSLTFNSLNLLLDLSFDLAAQLEQWLAGLQGDESGLRKSIQNLIDTNLSFSLKKLIGHANAAGKWGYQRPKNTQNLIKYWGFSGLPEIFSVDRAILQLKGSQKKKVLAAQAILQELALVFAKGVREIVQLAHTPGIVEKSLEKSAAHEPHLGLVYAFLRLFKQIQGELNSLSQAHLDFFYRQVLQLQELDVIADKAHLVFELAKQADSHQLQQGALFKAGKDANGADILFRLENEIILNKAKVASLRSLFISQEKNTAGDLAVRDIYMAPQANSADGQGEAFAVPGSSWKTLGNKESKFLDEDTGALKDHPYARLGFILASPVLLLREGKRTVSIKITAENDWPAGLEASDFNFFFSGAEGWFSPLADINGQCLEDCALVANADSKVLCLTAALDATEPSVIFPGAGLLEADYGLAQPMVMLVLDHEKARFPASGEYSLYGDLRNVKVSNIELQVKVCGLRKLVVQNDNSVLDANKPFMPFGPIPVANNSNFYVGSEEVFSKNWTQLDVNIAWKDLPPDPGGGVDRFKKHYEAYGPGLAPSQADFRVNASLLNNKAWVAHSDNPEQLFQAGPGGLCEDSAFTHFFHFVRTDFGSIEACEGFTPEGYTVDSQCGYLRFKLGGQDFLHSEYPKVLATQLLALGKADACIVPDAWYDVSGQWLIPNALSSNLQNVLNTEGQAAKNQANTTEASAANSVTSATNTVAKTQQARAVISIANLENAILQASDTFSKTSATKANATDSKAKIQDFFNKVSTQAGLLDALLDLNQDVPLPNEPYTPTIEAISMDYCAAANWEKDVAFLHLYPFEGTYLHQPYGQETGPAILPPFYHEGTLYVGLNDLKPGSNLNLLFQLAETTANPDVDKAAICWHYLKDNEWRLLKKDFELLADETEGLIRSGVIEFAIPRSISNQKTTIMPRGLHWLRATARLRADAVAETIAVHSQAARVEFVPSEDNDLQRLGQPLEAGAIAKMVENSAAVKSTSQFYPAFGGRSQESSDTFYTRVSERLRHKGRGITLHDYERLVLQAFPGIFKVKCITHTMGRRGKETRDYELSPGFVTVVVIPDLRKAKFADPFQPKVTFSTQTAIKDFLKKRLSPFIRLQVLNPKYEKVNLSGKIKFRQGKSTDFYLQQLNDDVALFLAPWANPEQQEQISFGGRIFKSSILNFIEKRPYVDYVVNFEMKNQGGETLDEIAATSARSILVGGVFDFEAYEAETCTVTSPRIPGQGIGYSKIKN